jgi:hypothetical protein
MPLSVPSNSMHHNHHGERPRSCCRLHREIFLRYPALLLVLLVLNTIRLSNLHTTPTSSVPNKPNQQSLLAFDESDVYPSEPIWLQQQNVGTISRLCPKGHSSSNSTSCWLMEPEQWTGCNNNGPKTIRSQPWMHPDLSSSTSGRNLVLYYGSHDSAGSQTIRALTSAQHDDGSYGPFEHVNNIRVPFTQCKSIHSPLLFVDNAKKMLYMYVKEEGVFRFQRH